MHHDPPDEGEAEGRDPMPFDGDGVPKAPPPWRLPSATSTDLFNRASPNGYVDGYFVSAVLDRLFNGMFSAAMSRHIHPPAVEETLPGHSGTPNGSSTASRSFDLGGPYEPAPPPPPAVASSVTESSSSFFSAIWRGGVGSNAAATISPPTPPVGGLSSGGLGVGGVGVGGGAMSALDSEYSPTNTMLRCVLTTVVSLFDGEEPLRTSERNSEGFNDRAGTNGEFNETQVRSLTNDYPWVQLPFLRLVQRLVVESPVEVVGWSTTLNPPLWTKLLDESFLGGGHEVMEAADVQFMRAEQTIKHTASGASNGQTKGNVEWGEEEKEGIEGGESKAGEDQYHDEFQTAPHLVSYHLDWSRSKTLAWFETHDQILTTLQTIALTYGRGSGYVHDHCQTEA